MWALPEVLQEQKCPWTWMGRVVCVKLRTMNLCLWVLKAREDFK